MRTKIFIENKLLLDIENCTGTFKLYDIMFLKKEKHMVETVSVDFIDGDPISSVYLRKIEKWENEYIK